MQGWVWAVWLCFASAEAESVKQLNEIRPSGPLRAQLLLWKRAAAAEVCLIPNQKNYFSCFNRRIKEKRWLNTSRDSERVNQLLCVFTQRVQTASAQSRDPLKTHFMRLSSLLHPVHVSCLCMVGVAEADEHLKGLLSAPPVFLHSQSV